MLPNGDTVRASTTEHADLFHGAAGSFGTLGVTTLFELRLIKAKAYVELTYQPIDSLDSTLEVLQSATLDPSNDYVDGILVSRDHGIVMSGRLIDTVPPGDLRIQTFNRARDPWFYMHAERITRGSTTAVKEAIPLSDYLFRYDRGAFWTGAYAFKYFMMPFNRVTRWVLDEFMKTRVMYHALHASGHARQYMIQDLAIPAQNAGAFVRYVDEKFGLYPLWLCPLRGRGPLDGKKMSMHPRSCIAAADEHVSNNGGLINVGVWGPGSSDYGKFVAANRDLEKEVRRLGGMKWLYAQAFYTEKEFWEIYGGREWYDGLRARYHAGHLADVYEKVRVDLREPLDEEDRTWGGWIREVFWGIWPMTGLYGVMQTVISRDYLLSK